ncbi:MAG: DUF1080 domain-containing protein [Planctomycetota bacterium]|nr:MAG: DUF1080 domain-containing protein [Planctomycetota bacterium]
MLLKTAAALAILIVSVSCAATEMQAEPLRPPEEAIVLFDGTDFSHWLKEDGEPAEWKILGDAMEVVPGKGSIMTKQTFQDFQLHVEFNVPQAPSSAKEQKGGNSGVYLQRRYEIQILDSYGVEAENNDCGAIYRVKAPDKNMCKKPGQWQSYDIRFRAARFAKENGHPKKTEDARVTVLHNGVVIHSDEEIPNKTGAGQPEGAEAGAILLQDHGYKVRFRNVWIVPADDAH